MPQPQLPHQQFDKYFQNDPETVHVFDFDYEKIIKFKSKVAHMELGICLPITALFCLPCLVKKNVTWEARAMHVALTVDGIRYVVDKHKTGCGSSCTDVGKTVTTIPYSNITDCYVVEPAGTACCCCIRNVLATVYIHTAPGRGTSSIGSRRLPDLVLEGLFEPLEFQQTLWAMKREDGAGRKEKKASFEGPSKDKEGSNTDVLQEIRDELRSVKDMLKQRQGRKMPCP
mmetsp:Transcript_110937/g.214844  ORF Transcript_110937/g.214844 Transcript_110937/m.214844 type:complete len:229 (+) Transcript_110937:88-774(+)